MESDRLRARFRPYRCERCARTFWERDELAAHTCELPDLYVHWYDENGEHQQAPHSIRKGADDA